MNCKLYYHPLSSYCWKALLGLYEHGTEFEPVVIDLGDRKAKAAFQQVWPLGKFPVLQVGERVIPESSVIVEYLGPRLLAGDALEIRLWDRFFDNYVQTPMQRIVSDTFRVDHARDPQGVEEACALLRLSYHVLERQLDGRTWIAGDEFSLADCSAVPALFYAGMLEPFVGNFSALSAYYERLLLRPSVQRVLEEAKPYFPMFPFKHLLPARFLA